MIFILVLAALVVLAALLPMLVDTPWNIKVSLVIFFFSYPVANFTGIFGLLIMWALGAMFMFFPTKENKNGTAN